MFHFDPLEKNEKAINRFLKKIFPEREILLRHVQKGDVTHIRISSRLQFILSFVFVGMLIWLSYVSFMYLFRNDLMQAKDKEILKAQQIYSSAITEIQVYRDNIARINKELEDYNQETVSFLTQESALDTKKKEELLRKRRLLTAELEYVTEKLNTFTQQIHLASLSDGDSSYRLREAELQRDIALAERGKLRESNSNMEKVVKDMKEAETQILEKVDQLADSGITGIDKTLSKIDQFLLKLGLSEDKLIQNLHKDKIDAGLGGPFISADHLDFQDDGLNNLFKTVSQKVERWENLKQIEGMLPLGNPLQKLRMTSSFGMRTDPFNGQLSRHTGIDFGDQKGTAVYTTAPGEVIYTGTRGAYGKTVEIDHGLGFTTLYAHLSKIDVEKGALVDAKNKIGEIGSTGRSNAPHLHYELRLNNQPVNPYTFVKAKKYVY